MASRITPLGVGESPDPEVNQRLTDAPRQAITATGVPIGAHS